MEDASSEEAIATKSIGVNTSKQINSKQINHDGHYLTDISTFGDGRAGQVHRA